MKNNLVEKPQIYLQIDELGNVLSLGQPIQDEDVLEEFFQSLKYLENNTLVSLFHGEPCIVEAFDEPLIALDIEVEEQLNSHNEISDKNDKTDNSDTIDTIDKNDIFKIYIQNEFSFEFSLKSLSLDEWDRFHGYTTENIPFVLTAKAQDAFFNLLDEFSDTSITWKNIEYQVPNYWSEHTDISRESFWSKLYQDNEFHWDLGTPTPGLTDHYASLKLPVSRIAVLGGGAGHDAAFLADKGHHVTLIDISPEAIQRAHALYGHIKNIQFVIADAFQLPLQYNASFDLIFEHTFYCAVDPQRRNELVKVWQRLLHETGQILGVFFIMEKRNGPPFGGSEWELKSRLQKNWRLLKWTRFKNSTKNRWGKELFVLAQKKSN